MKKIMLSLVCLCAVYANAQDLLKPNIYFKDMSYYNPSAGLSSNETSREIAAYSKYKFIDNDLWTKNMNVFVNHTGQINSTNFYSASYIYDNYSFYDRHSFYTGYSHRFNLSSSNMLSIGGRAVFNFDKTDWGKLGQIKDAPAKSLYFTPDLDLGILYRHDRLTWGLSVKNVFANSSKAEGEELFKNRRAFYTNASYRFDMGDKFSISPYTLVSYERKLDFDLGVHTSFFNIVTAAYHFRFNGFRNVGMVGLKVSDNLRINASYDSSLTSKDNNLEVGIAYGF